MQAKHSHRERIGNYELLHEIGEGGMARLYLGQHIFDGHQAAIKILHDQIARCDSFRKRLINEARAIASIHDPCVVRLYECGETRDGNIFLAMEHIQGETLDDRLGTSGELSVLLAMAIAVQIAGALSAAHAVGITHRDLKPSNIMLVEDSGKTGARLLDFGIAKFLNQTRVEPNLTMPGVILGTPSYMAPEQCAGSSDVDHRADIYSLGVLLYEMLTGRRPFTEHEPAEIIAQHLRGIPPSLRLLRPEVSERVETLVMRCLAKKPADRFQTAGELREALCRAMSPDVGGADWSEDPGFEEAPTSINLPAVRKGVVNAKDRALSIPKARVSPLAVTRLARPDSVTVAGPPSVRALIAEDPVTKPGMAARRRAASPGHDRAHQRALSPGYRRASIPAELEWPETTTPSWPMPLVQTLAVLTPELNHPESSGHDPRFVVERGALGVDGRRCATTGTLVLPYDSTGSSVERAGYASRIRGVIALPLLAVVLAVGFVLSGWNESIPAFIDDLQGLSAITCFECEGDQASRHDEATPGTIELAADGMPVSDDTPGMATGAADTADGSAAPANSATRPAKDAARPAKRAARSAKRVARSAKNRRVQQRARRVAKHRARRIHGEKREAQEAASSSSSTPPARDFDETPVF